MIARRFQDLECWQLSNELKRQVYAFIARDDVARDWDYCQQIRESARSAPRNTAEGFGRFRAAEFARFLEIARGSLEETRNHLLDAVDRRYLSPAECETLCALCDRASRATTGLIRYLKGRRAGGTRTPDR